MDIFNKDKLSNVTQQLTDTQTKLDAQTAKVAKLTEEQTKREKELTRWRSCDQLPPALLSIVAGCATETQKVMESHMAVLEQWDLLKNSLDSLICALASLDGVEEQASASPTLLERIERIEKHLDLEPMEKAEE